MPEECVIVIKILMASTANQPAQGTPNQRALSRQPNSLER
jgi:hypothetical protein